MTLSGRLEHLPLNPTTILNGGLTKAIVDLEHLGAKANTVTGSWSPRQPLTGAVCPALNMDSPRYFGEYDSYTSRTILCRWSQTSIRPKPNYVSMARKLMLLPQIDNCVKCTEVGIGCFSRLVLGVGICEKTLLEESFPRNSKRTIKRVELVKNYYFDCFCVKLLNQFFFNDQNNSILWLETFESTRNFPSHRTMECFARETHVLCISCFRIRYEPYCQRRKVWWCYFRLVILA